LALIDQSKDELIDLTRQMIRIPTENKQTIGGERECQFFLADRFKEFGFSTDIFTPLDVAGIEEHPYFVPGRDYINRPNVVATLKGNGSGKSLIISGHIDVCAKEPMIWKHDPFGAEIENGRIYGRGSLDMKGGLAAGIIAMKVLFEAGVKLNGSLYLESVVDEEGSGAGSLSCILRGYRADAVIIPEPTNMKVCPASMGEKYMRITIQAEHNKQYFGGGLNDINPVYGIAKIIDALYIFDKKRNQIQQENIHPLYRNVSNPLAISIEQLKAGDVGVPGAFGIPVSSWMLVSMRIFPGTTEAEFEKELSSFLEPIIEREPILKRNPPVISDEAHFLHPHEIDPDHAIVKTLSESFEQVCKKPARVEGAPFACDGFLFDKYGHMPVVILGPGGENAHAADEYVNIEDLINLAKIYALTIMNWCGYST